MRFDAVIFDLYGTLVDNIDEPGPYQDAYKRAIVEMARVLGAPADQFVQRLGATATGLRMTGAHPSAEQYIEYVCSVLGDTAGRRAGGGCARCPDGPIPQHCCPEAGLRSNPQGAPVDGPQHRPHHRLLMGDGAAVAGDATPSLLRRDVFSCAVGMRKPDPRIYAITCDQPRRRARALPLRRRRRQRRARGRRADGHDRPPHPRPLRDAAGPRQPLDPAQKSRPSRRCWTT